MVISLLVILLVLLSLFFLTKYLNNNLTEPNSNSVNNGLSSTISYVTNLHTRFEGRYLSWENIDNWSVDEYYDYNGMKAGSEGAYYYGLTGFTISRGDKLVFSFKGIDGIGGNGACDEIYKFSDTDLSYIDNQVNAFLEQGQMSVPPINKEPTVIDLSDKSYSEINLFGNKIRRIDTQLYWKTNDEEFFNPKCGLNAYIQTFINPQFDVNSDIGHSRHGTYVVDIEDSNMTLDELNILDELLNSFKTK